MQFLVLSLCFALLFNIPVFADSENEVRRGTFPFMAYVYYSDNTVVDEIGNRFLRSAALFKPDWLITSYIMDDDNNLTFSTKTLLARLGAISIDANFTLNEDEDEQEREIIQIVRPVNIDKAPRWHVDISLLKTLTPFNITTAVNTIPLQNTNDEINDKTCVTLVYVRKTNSDEKVLLEIIVKQIQSSEENCGERFHAGTMRCGEKESYANMSQDFCQGNSGGPLVCDNVLVGLQTYVDECKPPYLYQYVPAWLSFITCGVEGKCQEEQCSKLCRATDKDVPKVDLILDSISPTSTALTSLETEQTEDTMGRTEETITTENLKTTVKQTAVDYLSTNDTNPTIDSIGTTTTKFTTIMEPITEARQATTQSKSYEVELMNVKGTTLTEAPRVDAKTPKPVVHPKTKVHSLKTKINAARRFDESESDQVENTEKSDIEYQQESIKESIQMVDRGENNVCIIHSLFLTVILLFCVI